MCWFICLFSFQVHFGNVVPKEDKAQGRVTLRIYLQYLMAGGGYLGLVVLLVLLFIAEVNVISYLLFNFVVYESLQT